MTASTEASIHTVSRRHLRFGWWSLLGFLTLGLMLEALHGFKIGWYLDVANETRRHLWTLAHAHGTLLAILNIVFGLSLGSLPEWGDRTRKIASQCLIGAGFLMPGGFLLGGIVIYGGDPGLAILLLPLGAALLVAAVALTARQQ